MANLTVDPNLPDPMFILRLGGVTVWVGDRRVPAPIQGYDEVIMGPVGYQILQEEFVDNYPLQ